MRTKAFLTSLLLASSTLAGVASAAPIVRDHRMEPVITANAPVRYGANMRVQARPHWMSNVTYGFQVSGNGQYAQPYPYGHDPRIESTPRSSWVQLANMLRLNVQSSLIVPVNQHLSVLELQSQWANVEIDRVRVDLNDGRAINVRTDRLLDRTHAPNLRIDLGSQASCGVRDVVVSGRGGGTFRILGA